MDPIHDALAPFPGSRRALVGVSGGRDSVALLHALVSHGHRRLIVCHFNHRLRGRASTEDAKFVARLATRYGLEWAQASEPVAALAESEKLSIETAARLARYRFLARVAREHRCPTVFLAHHAEDQAETILFNLFRGTGPHGLCGMSQESEQTIPIGTGRPVRLRILRPFLSVRREALDRYLRQNRLAYREDASNLDAVHTRNALRQHLLPAIRETMGRDVTPALLHLADLLREEQTFLSTLHPEKEEATLSVPELRAAPVALQRRRLLRWLRGHGIPQIGFEEVERVRTLLHHPATAKVNLPGGHYARRREKRLFLTR